MIDAPPAKPKEVIRQQVLVTERDRFAEAFAKAKQAFVRKYGPNEINILEWLESQIGQQLNAEPLKPRE